MAEDKTKQPDDELDDEQLDDVSDGQNKRFDGGFF